MARKYLFISYFFFMIFSINSSYGESGPIYDTHNMPIGSVHSNGDVTGSNGLLICTISPEGVIYDTQNMPMGRVHKNGDITGSNGLLIGSLDAGGTVYDTHSMPIGSVHSNGDVTGSNGLLIATTPDPRVGAILLLHVLNLK